jgi:hypothetical protein
LVCSNCGGGSDTAAVVVAAVAATTALVTLGIAVATFKTAGATRKAAEATEDATKATRDAAKATNRAADATAREATATLNEAEASLQLVGVTRQQFRRGQMPVVMPIARGHWEAENTLPTAAGSLALYSSRANRARVPRLTPRVRLTGHAVSVHVFPRAQAAKRQSRAPSPRPAGYREAHDSFNRRPRDARAG